ncbi:MAG: BREX-1 system adenine-specific DNA-methyltransferase PglX, partial [Acidobacteria bacterium]|nr:BREX-1 system adenine-specific DNA-methyltransferase PglX [Acidobacteriota bacterium]
MNTSALKTFAPAVRRQLMEAVTRKLDFVLAAQTPDYLTTYKPQVEALRKLAAEDRRGLIERVAYTWFNRLAALRYLDAKGWHPFLARVLTAATPEETQPELLKLMRTGLLPEELHRHTNLSRLNDLLDGRIPSSDPPGEVYRHLVLAACRFYHALLPNLFERLDDETELMLPDDLLTEHSVAQGFRTEITDEDCSEVELLGWLYQFYIAEKKDEVMARKSAVPTEDIPAVTQLFTPHWIVRFLVENSLGRLWLLNRPGSRLREQMPYYIEGEAETDFLKINRPEEIRLLDPAVGSGHMLTYAYDLLYAIYEEEGYAPSDIPGLILTHNLHGVDICPRAAQLASLALVLKAREKSRRFFQPDKLAQPRILALQDVRFDEGDLREYIRALKLGELFNQPVMRLMRHFEQATTFGSLIQPCLGEAEIAFIRRAIEDKDLGGQLFLSETHGKVLSVLEQAERLTQRYHSVVANPPYMGLQNLNPSLKKYLQKSFEDYKGDLYSAFIARIFELIKPGGMAVLMTPFTWMFIKTYENVRRLLIAKYSIRSLIRPEYHAFFDSAFVPICAFTVFCGDCLLEATYIDLGQFYGREIQEPMALEAIQSSSCSWKYRVHADDLSKIPGMPIAYWATVGVLRLFELSGKLGDQIEARQGLITANNDRFMRRWWEPFPTSIKFPENRRAALSSNKKWFPYNKGGEFRKWYGNGEFVVNWEQDGREIKEFTDTQGK